MEILTPISMWLGPRVAGVLGPFNGHPTLANGLVSYWKLDEQSGTRVDSVTATGNDLTDNNTVTFIDNTGGAPPPKNIAASTLAANSEYLSRADNSSLRVTGESFTFSGWWNPGAVSSNFTFFAKYNTGAGHAEYVLYQSGVDGQLRFAIGNGTAFEAEVPLGSDMPLNQWNHFVCWYDVPGNTLNLKVNGGTTAIIGATASIGGSLEPFTIGRYYTGSAYSSSGYDELGFWKRVLTPSEMSDLYNSGSGLYY